MPSDAENQIAEIERPNRAVLACINAWERYYCWSHRLVPVGPLFLVGCKPYMGKVRTFPDNTVLEEGDRVGSIHLNNARISTLGVGAGRHPTAWQFARLLRASLVSLAQFTTSENASAIAVYQGTTWMQPHGLKVGFSTELVTENWQTKALRLQFRILHACFSPASFASRPKNMAPRNFWITRAQLLKNFGTGTVV